ncbi:DUF6443 domain-containing protein [Ekhidna sp.]|uniref:DUF6443 domain-containing protein n=1 Tax=Ekhidna sp. TaxID=2608089 RepID=UPI0032F0465C
MNLKPGSIASGSETICRGSNPGVISSTAGASGGVGNYQYQWQFFSELQQPTLEGGGSVLEDNWHDLPGETGLTFDPPVLNMNMTYRRKVTSGSQVAYTSAKSYTVSAPLTAGSISYSGGSVNADGNPPAITGTAATGGITRNYQWQQKVGTATGFSNISGATNQNYNPPAGIDYTTTYRRRVQSCGETKYSNQITINVNFHPGSISGNQIICSGGTPSNINSTAPAKGGKGSYNYQWQKRVYRPGDILPKDLEQPIEGGGTTSSEDPIFIWTPWNDIPGETGLLLTPDAQLFSTEYRRVVNSGGTEKISNVIAVSLIDLSDAGTITYSGGTINAGQIPSTLTGTLVTSNDNFSYQWQQKVGANYVDIAGANGRNFTPQDPLATSTFFRRLVRNDCGVELISNSIKVPVGLTPGQITTDPVTICHGCTSPTLNATSPTGGSGQYNYQWQVLNPLREEGDPLPLEDRYMDVLNGGKNASYSPGELFFNSTFRRKVVSDGQTKYTNTITISVYPILNAGTISYTGKVCEGSDPGNITGTAATGGDNSYEYQWQYYNGSGWVELVRGSQYQNYDPSLALSADTKFRRRVRSTGSTWKKSLEITIEVYDIIENIGSLSAPGNKVCPAERVTFTYHPASGVNTSKTRLFGMLDGTETDFGVISDTKAIHVHKGYTYYVKYLQRCTPIDYSTNTKSFTFFENCNVPPSMDRNFVRTEVARVSESDEYNFSILTENDKTTSYNYIDGLGRTVQEVTYKGSPAKKDIVQAYVFDKYGRQPIEYLPYSQNNTGAYQLSAINNQSNFYSNGSKKVAQDDRPFTEYTFERSPLNRVRSIYNPGQDWFLNNKDTHNNYRPNVTDEVLLWIISSGLPVSTAYYGPNQLWMTETIGEDGQTSREFKNGRGELILKRIKAATSPVEWYDTYYIYDDFGDIRFVLPPKLVNLTQSPNQTQVRHLAFENIYDEEHRVIKKYIPGSIEPQYIVYDRWDRVVMTQDGVQRSKASKEWSYIKYDLFNREIIKGTISDNRSLADIQEAVLADAGRHENRNSSSIGYSMGSSFPRNPGYSTILSVTYYDDYYFLAIKEWDNEEHNFGFSNVPDFLNSFNESVIGLVTGSKIRGLENKWLNGVIYYDNRYRQLQIINENHLNGLDRQTNKMDFTGNILKSQLDHQSIHETLKVESEFMYDHQNRLLRQFVAINDEPQVLILENEYNELGQLIETDLHSSDNGNTFLQSVDKRFNIRGWLKSINNHKLSNDGGNTNDDANDVFGLSLSYNQDQYTVNGSSLSKRYTGNVAGAKWKVSDLISEPIEQAYVYKYDLNNRLQNASYGTFSGSDTNFNGPEFYSMNASYDENGNIINLSRNGNLDGTQIQMDELTYTYENSNESNRLFRVTDDGDDNKGFKELPSMPGRIYYYDQNGNMTSDLYKEITNIEYNKWNFPTKVIFLNGMEVDLYYDGNGNKLRKSVKNGSSIQTIDYTRVGQYEDNELSFVNTPTGRVIKQLEGFHYEYYLKDHLGNTRVVFGYLPERKIYEAKMESENSGQEESEFSFPSGIRTNVQNNTFLGDESVALNGSISGKQVGPAKVLPVSSGDRVSIEVWAKYIFENWNNTSVGDIAGIITSSFNVASVGTGATEASTALGNALENPGASGLFVGSSEDRPKAYLQYLFFDSDYNYVAEGSGFVPVTTDSEGDFSKLETEALTFESSGHLFIYIANESNQDAEVFFDDLKIVHEGGDLSLKLTQTNDFYPFGLTFNSVNSEGTPKQRFLFNGKEHQDNTGWFDFGARMYNPEIGRWHNIDPLAEKYFTLSPYSYVANNPVNAIDPDGRYIIFINGLRLTTGANDQLTSPYYTSGGLPFIYSTDVYNYWSTGDGETNGFGREVDLVSYYTNKYADDKTLFTSGSSTWTSQADQRKTEGMEKAKMFHEMAVNGDIVLEEGETIKIVSHSQGGAHAAGFAEQLLSYTDADGNQLYDVEVIEYITPHQPTDIDHPEGVEGIQYSHENDAVSGNGAPWWLLNGGTMHGAIPGIQKFIEGNIYGEEGQPAATGILQVYFYSIMNSFYINGYMGNRNGHNVTDNDLFIQRGQ